MSEQTRENLGDLGARSAAWASLHSGFVDVRGTSAHVVRGGRSVADGGDPVPHLFVHGLGGSCSNWFEVMAALGEDREVIAVDLPGFGRTVPPRASASRVRANARFLPVFMDALGIDRAIIHGNSMGGMLTTYLAALAPERIDRAILVGPALPTAKSDLTHLSPMVFKRFAPFIVPGVGSTVLRALWSRSTVDALMADVIRMSVWDREKLSSAMLTIMRENIATAQRTPWRIESLSYAIESLVAALLGGRELNDAVATLTPRTLVLWGERDVLVGRPVIDHLASRRPDWSIVVLRDVGHVPMMEAPARYVATVQAWLEGRPFGAIDDVVRFEDFVSAG